MFCPHCGKEISDRAVSCPNCGEPGPAFVTQPQQLLVPPVPPPQVPMKKSQLPVYVFVGTLLFFMFIEAIAGAVNGNGVAYGLGFGLGEGLIIGAILFVITWVIQKARHKL